MGRADCRSAHALTLTLALTLTPNPNPQPKPQLFDLATNARCLPHQARASFDLARLLLRGCEHGWPSPLPVVRVRVMVS